VLSCEGGYREYHKESIGEKCGRSTLGRLCCGWELILKQILGEYDGRTYSGSVSFRLEISLETLFFSLCGEIID
jgi:hypothetical protein